MGVGGVYFWVNKKAKTRMSLLEEQLPDAVELMVRSLRVGHPFSAAIGIVAKEIADPLGTEFGVIADEAAYGRDVAESLKAFAERMDSQDLRFLAVAVSIQQTSGGNLAEILEGLAKVIRARFKLFRRVKAITAEAKWSGMFLSAFPIAGAGHDQRHPAELLRRGARNLGLHSRGAGRLRLPRHQRDLHEDHGQHQGLRAHHGILFSAINDQLIALMGPLGPLFAVGLVWAAADPRRPADDAAQAARPLRAN